MNCSKSNSHKPDTRNASGASSMEQYRQTRLLPSSVQEKKQKKISVIGKNIMAREIVFDTGIKI